MRMKFKDYKYALYLFPVILVKIVFANLVFVYNSSFSVLLLYFSLSNVKALNSVHNQLCKLNTQTLFSRRFCGDECRAHKMCSCSTPKFPWGGEGSLKQPFRDTIACTTKPPSNRRKKNRQPFATAN